MPVWWLSLWPHSMKVLASHLLANWSLSFCVESAYTPHALRVHRLPPTVQRRLVCGVNWWL